MYRLRKAIRSPKSSRRFSWCHIRTSDNCCSLQVLAFALCTDMHRPAAAVPGCTESAASALSVCCHCFLPLSAFGAPSHKSTYDQHRSAFITAAPPTVPKAQGRDGVVYALTLLKHFCFLLVLRPCGKASLRLDLSIS